MTHDLWQAIIQITGGINAILLGILLLFSPRLHRTRARQKFGLALLAYGYLLFSFTAVDNLWVPGVWWIWYIDFFVVLLASALFLDYMNGALGAGSISRYFYLPAIMLLVFLPILGTRFIAGPAAIEIVIGVQIVYTVMTTWLYIKSNRRLLKRPRHLRVLLIGLWSLHAFQVARLLLSGSDWLFDGVPLLGALLILLLTALVLTDSRSLRMFSQVASLPATLPLDIEAINQYMRVDQPYLDSGLGLEELAGALGLSRGELSRLISETTDGNFYAYINRYRVTKAIELLRDPDEQRTSIEAIGLMSGFRARSTFYEAFRREVGKTPAQYRSEPN